jgi:RNA polymerase sigma factor (TIGR02999 family)
VDGGRASGVSPSNEKSAISTPKLSRPPAKIARLDGAPPDPNTVTTLLHRWKAGDANALDALMPLVYDQLKRLARNHMLGERGNHTLQQTALVHEAYLEIAKMDGVNDRAHFFAAASRAMRNILVDHARSRQRDKRGAGAVHVDLDEASDQPAPHAGPDLLELDAALTRLAGVDQRQSDMLTMKYFGGLSQAELAEVFKVSLATVNRDLDGAKRWLKDALAL